MLKEKWVSAMALEEFIEQAEENQELWRAVHARARVPAELIERLRALPAKRYLLVLLEDWCGDAVNTVPAVARLAEALPGLELRVLRRDEHPELMDAHLSGTSRAIPVVIVLDEHFRELGWWGTRPRELQAWFRSPEAQAMEKADRYREMRRWYARDAGRSTLEEIAVLLEAGGVGEGADGDAALVA
jgi:hypothetical protein